MSTTVDMSGDTLYVAGIVQATAQGNLSGALIPAYEYTTIQLTSSSASQTVWMNTSVGGTYQIAGVTSSFGTASSSGTLQVEVATGTQAIGSGTNQLTGTIALSGTANTPASGTLVTTPTVIASGNRVNIIIAGTMTSLANAFVTIALQRVS
jgi:hypothetical protein